MEASGIWDQRYDEIDDVERARKLPSPQFAGSPERATLDLNSLSAAGVEIVGRPAAVRDGRALFSGGLRNQFALADLKMNRLPESFDERGLAVGPPERFEPTRAPNAPRLSLERNARCGLNDWPLFGFNPVSRPPATSRPRAAARRSHRVRRSMPP